MAHKIQNTDLELVDNNDYDKFELITRKPEDAQILQKRKRSETPLGFDEVTRLVSEVEVSEFGPSLNFAPPEISAAIYPAVESSPRKSRILPELKPCRSVQVCLH